MGGRVLLEQVGVGVGVVGADAARIPAAVTLRILFCNKGAVRATAIAALTCTLSNRSYTIYRCCYVCVALPYCSFICLVLSILLQCCLISRQLSDFKTAAR